MIFFLMVLVILVFVVLWNYDLHKILYVKSIAQNGGDSAALMAARWQGITLNVIGDLNIMHALAIQPDGTDADIAASISNVQARLCFVGPMIAFMASQQAAKNNHVFQNADYAEGIRALMPQIEEYIREGEPESYPGCWREHADMLEFMASQGIAVAPDNIRRYGDYSGPHILLRIDFYEAIAGRNWCWFYHNAPTLLEDYENFFPCWWEPLPPPNPPDMNNQIYGLGLKTEYAELSGLTANPGAMATRITALASDRELGTPASTNFMDTPATWYCYSPGAWSTWDAMSTEGEYPFPATGTVKPQYNYTGADAVTRIETPVVRITPGPKGAEISAPILWTAAAKPFGYLNEADRPDSCGLVLPAFHEIALIPLDASSAPSGGGFNLPWYRHTKDHLPVYMTDGPSASSCFYCRQLLTWENEAFRQAGVLWLSTNSYRCIITGGPGGGGHRGGGVRRGH